MLYNLFKFIHVSAAIVWIGGALALMVINARLARSQNKAVLEALAQQATFYGRTVLGPATLLTLLAGMATAGMMRVGFGTLWIVWGLAGIFVSLLLGAVFIRRATARLGQLAAASAPDQTALSAAQRQLGRLNLVNLLVLLSVVAAMVFKPGF